MGEDAKGDPSHHLHNAERSASNNWVQVPVRYLNDDSNPSCNITVDLDGYWQNNVFVLVPYNTIRDLAESINAVCVAGNEAGVFASYGLHTTTQALLDPTAYNGSAIPNMTATVVQQPDGIVDSVALPRSSVPEGGPSKQNALVCCAPVGQCRSRIINAFVVLQFNY